MTLFYNLTARGLFADFSLDNTVLLFSDTAYPSPHFEKTIRAVHRRLTHKKLLVCAMTDQPRQKLSARIVNIPWSELALV